MILTGDRFYPNAENLLSILILQFVLFMHVFHLLYFVSNKDVQSFIAHGNSTSWINGWVNNREAGDLRRYRAHYDVIVMSPNTLNHRVPFNSLRPSDAYMRR